MLYGIIKKNNYCSFFSTWSLQWGEFKREGIWENRRGGGGGGGRRIKNRRKEFSKGGNMGK